MQHLLHMSTGDTKMKKTDLNLTNKTNGLSREVSHSNAVEASSWHCGQTEEGVTRAWVGTL